MSQMTLTHDYPSSVSFDSANLNGPALHQQYSERRSETFTKRPGAVGTRCTVWTHFRALLKIHLLGSSALNSAAALEVCAGPGRI
jgi:hypothetical protein